MVVGGELEVYMGRFAGLVGYVYCIDRLLPMHDVVDPLEDPLAFSSAC